ITNLPLHQKKIRQRGFDQTQILAKELAKKLNKKYLPILQRIRYTKAQAQLDKNARAKNIANAFRVTIPASDQKSILLIDDVVTTGSTLNEAAKVLAKAGYNKIICLVIAKN